MTDDFGAGRFTNGRAILGTPVAGTIEVASDRDFFRVALEEGRLYTFDIDGAWLGDIRDTRYERGVMLYEAFEDRVLYESDVPHAESLIFASQGAGDHYIALVQDRSGPVPAAYTLTVRPHDPAEVTAGTAGVDYIHWQEGMALVEGRAGNDALSFALSDRTGLSFTVTGQGRGQVDVNSFFSTGSGSDLLTRFAGIDRLTGSSQADRFMSDAAYSAQPAAVNARGLGGADIFHLDDGRDYVDGGGGSDTVTYAYAGSRDGVTASLFAGRGWTGEAEGDRYRNVEHLTGTDRADVLTGDHGNNRLHGRSGDDTIMGNGGSDTIVAGLGVDVIVYSGNRDDYFISEAPPLIEYNPGGAYAVPGIHVSDQRFGGGDGFDTVYQAAILRFADGDFIL